MKKERKGENAFFCLLSPNNNNNSEKVNKHVSKNCKRLRGKNPATPISPSGTHFNKYRRILKCILKFSSPLYSSSSHHHLSFSAIHLL